MRATALRLTVFVAVSLALASNAAPAAQQKATEQGPTSPAQTNQLDINTASAAELKQLPGMGVIYAKRVIEGRPYTAKNQLVTRGILPQEAYARIRDLIVAHHLARTP